MVSWPNANSAMPKGSERGRGGGEQEFSQGSQRPSFVASLLGDRPRECLTGSDLLVLGTGVAGGGVSILCIRTVGLGACGPVGLGACCPIGLGREGSRWSGCGEEEAGARGSDIPQYMAGTLHSAVTPCSVGTPRKCVLLARGRDTH